MSTAIEPFTLAVPEAQLDDHFKAAIAAVRQAITGDDQKAIAQAVGELQTLSHQMAEQLYTQTQANASHAAGGPTSGTDPDVKEGEVVTQTYTVRATDDQSATVDQVVTITINGTNDVPVVTNADAAKAGSVTEAGNGVVGTSTATGTLTSSDVDAAATKTWSIVGTNSTTYGAFTLNATTGVWTCARPRLAAPPSASRSRSTRYAVEHALTYTEGHHDTKRSDEREENKDSDDKP